MRTNLGLIAAVAMLTAVPPYRLTAQQHPVPASTSVSGTLRYDGHGTFGGFVGTTDSVIGRLNAAADLSRVSGYVAARAGTLRTGNGKRDRDQWSSLEVDSFPYIRYDVDSVTVGATTHDTIAVTLHGRFDIHGVRRVGAGLREQRDQHCEQGRHARPTGNQASQQHCVSSGELSCPGW